GRVPTGTVTFFNGATSLGPVTLVSVTDNGVAILSTSTLSVGAHTITAQYSGDGTYSPLTSGSTIVTVIGKAVPIVGLSVIPDALVNNQAVTLWTQLAGPSGVPSGTVAFFDGL